MKVLSMARYATISRLWQGLIEQHTFRKLYLTDKRLDAAQAILRSANRLTYLRECEYEIGMSQFSEDITEYNMHKKQNAILTQHVSQLFTAFHSLQESSNGSMSNIKLRLHAHITDTPGNPNEQQYSFNTTDKYGCENGPYLEIDWSGFDFPPLDMITQFHVNDGSGGVNYKRLHPRTCCELAEKFTNLDSIYWNLSDTDENRGKIRAEFAKSLEKLPKTLTNLYLSYKYDEPLEGEQPSDIVTPKNQRDPLSAALGLLIQRLAKIFIRASLDTSVYSDGFDEPPHWPHLQSINMSISAFTPSGTWLLERPHGSLNETALKEWLMAMGKAVPKMPSLKTVWTSTAAPGWPQYGWFHVRLQMEEGTVEVKAMTDFELGEDVRKVWGGVCGRSGRELEMLL